MNNIKSLLAKLAYEMTEKEELVITEEKIKQVNLNITSDHNVYGLLQSVQFVDVTNIVRVQRRCYNFHTFCYTRIPCSLSLKK